MPQEHRFHLTRLSANIKLGGLPCSTTSKSTCPDNCSLKDNGCFADAGPLNIHWKKVSEGSRGTDLDTFCDEIRKLPKHSLWRHNQAGDLPGNRHQIDHDSLRKIVSANKGRVGFTYTHYDPADPDNAEAIGQANANGFTINLSAETLEQADEFVARGVGPVVVLLPQDQTENLVTPDGHTVLVCPASIGDTTCALCALCAVATRKSIVGFPAHGSGKAKAEKVFWATKEVLETA